MDSEVCRVTDMTEDFVFDPNKQYGDYLIVMNPGSSKASDGHIMAAMRKIHDQATKCIPKDYQVHVKTSFQLSKIVKVAEGKCILMPLEYDGGRECIVFTWVYMPGRWI